MTQSGLPNARYTIETSGLLKFSKQFDVVVDFNGLTIDFSEIKFEGRVGMTNFVKLINTGVNSVWILFDGDHNDIDIDDRGTYNLKINAGTGYNAISLAGHCSKIAMISAPDVVNEMMVIVI